MFTINVRNVQFAIAEGFYLLSHSGERLPSRNGAVIQAKGPVLTVFRNPLERVMFWPERDANPFFHLMEALWMLDGRNNLSWPQRFVSTFNQFSDNGITLHGAYGHRWRVHFYTDQLVLLIEHLRKDLMSRRAVLQMWDPQADLDNNGKDVPCNTTLFFNARHGQLDLTICCRSNDMVWGAYGANAVHFSVLQEFVAGAVGIPVGKMYQLSNDYHVYENWWNKLSQLFIDRAGSSAWTKRGFDPYSENLVRPYNMFSEGSKEVHGQQDYIRWLTELHIFMQDPANDSGLTYTYDFFPDVAIKMYRAHREYKEPQPAGSYRYTNALRELADCMATDWKDAACEWIIRRQRAAEKKGEQS